MLLITLSKAQEKLALSLKNRRLIKGLTQVGLAERSGVSVSSLRKFERTGQLSLTSFLKLCMTLECLEEVLDAVKPSEQTFSSIEEVVNAKEPKAPKRGWRK